MRFLFINFRINNIQVDKLEKSKWLAHKFIQSSETAEFGSYGQGDMS